MTVVVLSTAHVYKDVHPVIQIVCATRVCICQSVEHQKFVVRKVPNRESIDLLKLLERMVKRHSSYYYKFVQ